MLASGRITPSPPRGSACARWLTMPAALQERVSYSAYGEAQHHFPADMDGDGDVDSTDTMWFTNLHNLKEIDEAGYNGYLFNAETKLYTVRFRHYEP